MSFTRLPGALRFAFATGLAVLTLAAAPAFAQSEDAPVPAAAPKSTDVVVTIGDQTITEADIGFAAEDLAQDLANLPADSRRAFLVSVLIDMKLMAQAARDADLDKTELFQQRLGYLEERALRRSFFSDTVNRTVTKEAVEAAYDAYVADFEPQEEVRVRHVLVSTEEDAAAVKAELDEGKPFEIAALEYSQDGTAQKGGDLGYFNRDSNIVPEFMEAAYAMEVGAVSDPVQTQFGWHILKLEDKRMSAPPSLEEVGAQLQQKVMVDAFSSAVTKLKDAAEISFTDPDFEKAVKAADEAMTQQ